MKSGLLSKESKPKMEKLFLDSVKVQDQCILVRLEWFMLDEQLVIGK
jgi:hypothetical protein